MHIEIDASETFIQEALINITLWSTVIEVTFSWHFRCWAFPTTAVISSQSGSAHEICVSYVMLLFVLKLKRRKYDMLCVVWIIAIAHIWRNKHKLPVRYYHI